MSERRNVTVTIYCEVFDADALYKSALEHALTVDKIDRETAEGILTSEDEDYCPDCDIADPTCVPGLECATCNSTGYVTTKEPNVAECVRMLIDMGSAPGEGFSIESSDTEETT